MLRNEYFNAAGVTLSKRNPPLKSLLYPCLPKENSTLTALNLLANVHPGLPNDSAGYPGLVYGL